MMVHSGVFRQQPGDTAVCFNKTIRTFVVNQIDRIGGLNAKKLKQTTGLEPGRCLRGRNSSVAVWPL
jgi:hypothetical protein